MYFQPGWVGLSIVEAMAYGKPICTFVRSKETLQCVEYSYIINEKNGLIFNDINDFIKKIETISYDDIKSMGHNAKLLVKEKLTIENMVKNAISIL
jgi:glycosyltransferase involved in cell wall biosynthesis